MQERARASSGCRTTSFGSEIELAAAAGAIVFATWIGSLCGLSGPLGIVAAFATLGVWHMKYQRAREAAEALAARARELDEFRGDLLVERETLVVRLRSLEITRVLDGEVIWLSSRELELLAVRGWLTRTAEGFIVGGSNGTRRRWGATSRVCPDDEELRRIKASSLESIDISREGVCAVRIVARSPGDDIGIEEICEALRTAGGETSLALAHKLTRKG
jgi:hypothetical protein